MNTGKANTTLDTTVELDIPREVIRLLSEYEFIARVRDGKDKSKASTDVFHAIGMSELSSPVTVRIVITVRGTKRLLEWLDELEDKVVGDIAIAKALTRDAADPDRLERETANRERELDDAKSST
jgi:hypothetical protein